MYTCQCQVLPGHTDHGNRSLDFRRIDMKMLYPGFDSRRTRKAFDEISRMMSNERSSMDETFDNGRIRHAEIETRRAATWLGALRVAVVVEGHLEQAPEALLTKAPTNGTGGVGFGVGMSDVTSDFRCQMSDNRCQMSDIKCTLDRVRARYILPDGGIHDVSRIPYSSSECTTLPQWCEMIGISDS